MRHTRTCAHCGAKSVEYPHGLTRAIVQPLAILSRHGGEARISDILDHTQNCNFHKLAYWRLAEPLHDGVWAITERGRAFLAGQIAMPKTAWSWRGKFSRFEGKLLLITDIMPEAYAHRADYAANAQPRFTDSTLSLFE
jgi:hypothetical protein